MSAGANPNDTASLDRLPPILLVDDDEALLRMFSALFTKHGFHVVTAVDGKEGAEVALSRES